MHIVKRMALQLPWWKIVWAALALFACLMLLLLAHALTLGCGPSDTSVFMQRNYWP